MATRTPSPSIWKTLVTLADALLAIALFTVGAYLVVAVILGRSLEPWSGTQRTVVLLLLVVRCVTSGVEIGRSLKKPT